MRTHVAEWLAKWSEAPIGTARLVMAAVLFLWPALSVTNFLTQIVCTVVQTGMYLAANDKTAAVNLAVREGQIRGLHADKETLRADVSKLSVQCARR